MKRGGAAGRRGDAGFPGPAGAGRYATPGCRLPYRPAEGKRDPGLSPSPPPPYSNATTRTRIAFRFALGPAGEEAAALDDRDRLLAEIAVLRRRVAELEQADPAAALRESEERLRCVVETVA